MAEEAKEGDRVLCGIGIEPQAPLRAFDEIPEVPLAGQSHKAAGDDSPLDDGTRVVGCRIS